MPREVRPRFADTVGPSGVRVDVRTVNPPRPEVRMEFRITSSAFRPGGEIPARHTCDGADVSPALEWSGVPTPARSLVLVVDDPDAPDPAAPVMTWVHWILYDIPPRDAALPADVAPSGLPPGTRRGRNGWKEPGWRGPCPPIGRHRYYFKLYAVDRVLGDLGLAAKEELERELVGHILAKAELVGTYERERQPG